MKSDKSSYKKDLHNLQVELVKLQRHIIKYNHRILVILEGRDASGKDGAIKRITAHLSPRETRVVALGKPTERETRAWYFQRYVSHLPLEAEMVFFNRSWYNRAGVEKVMQYCTEEDYVNFMNTVNDFEDLLIRSGLNLLKYYLDISRDEQKRRLADRKKDPLKQWKISPVDQIAVKRWDAYSEARNEMLERTSSKSSPWVIVKADNKRAARLNLIRDILSRIDCPEKNEHLCRPDHKIVFTYNHSLLKNGRLAP
jgi:polyphosphate kinase 2